jgi:hypothetical protein
MRILSDPPSRHAHETVHKNGRAHWNDGLPHVTLYMIVNPHDVSTVDVKWGLSGTVADPQHPDVIAYRDLCFAFNAEDKTQLEGVQQGLQSRFYRGGPLAPADFEGTIWDFYQYIAARLGGVAHGDPIRR